MRAPMLRTFASLCSRASDAVCSLQPARRARPGPCSRRSARRCRSRPARCRSCRVCDDALGRARGRTPGSRRGRRSRGPWSTTSWPWSREPGGEVVLGLEGGMVGTEVYAHAPILPERRGRRTAQSWSDWVVRYSSKPYGPSSRPKPDDLNPPNGASGLNRAPFTSTWPTRSRRPNATARSRSSDQTPAARPYRCPSASATRVVLAVVGVDDEHRPEDLLLRDLGRRVDVGEHGGTDPVAACPARRRLEPAGRERRTCCDARARKPRTRSRCAADTSGPIALARRVARQLRRRRDRDGLVVAVARHEQPGPRVARLAGVEQAARDAGLDRPRGTASSETSGSTTFADLPPSSSTTRVPDCAASAATTPTGAHRARERHEVDARVRERGPRRRPGRRRARRTGRPSADPAASGLATSSATASGATSLGLSTTVQPAASAGAIFATTWCSG